SNFGGQFKQSMGLLSHNKKRMLINGNEAVALGAAAAGCTFIAAYPMTPATSIMEYLAGKSAELGLAVVQPEDEIAAINMAIGGALAGARAMTATSGGGFSLMVEGLSLAGITETPIVIILAQRPGPAVGLPTRTEQGELGFAIHAGHGEFPRAVLAPGTAEDCFWLTVKAFNLADKYQVPVIVLTDQHLASSYVTVDSFDLSKVKIDRGLLLTDDDANKLAEYERHQITESGVSPRALPLQGRLLVATDSDEHGEEGHIIEDAETRKQMVLKRLRKLDGVAGELGQPRFLRSPEAKLTLVGWGSTYGAIREAVSLLQRDGVPANILQLNELWPFPAEAVSSALGGNCRSYVVENNATGQLARLIRAETGIRASGSILKFDGRPFSPEFIVKELKKEVS
ncbi:MAG: 2-oxoacid:acceptor oxidoreductase subunit alpha, partial [Chloroflexota bacterium]